MFKKTLTRYLENYAGFSEANITKTVFGRGSCLSPQQFAVLLTLVSFAAVNRVVTRHATLLPTYNTGFVLSFGVLFPELMAHFDVTTETPGEYITLHVFQLH